ncbi:hypothetical protein [Lichenifustis flavocetrariae]|uniref:Uncharacterized protein n=1 Tax=Lichenifustis flavocetrariae TaxID=2949735 RepID=A0AA41YVK4_9HYPH|nr:hypothetical protein [Lichenifustis flavocetrariae]MCW6508021.1 hypothetical protein [Lichenifustis flavocetrariae]
MRFALMFAGAVLLAAAPSTSWAGDSLDFVVPVSDGYGIADCMKPGMACGQVIADAWCEAHGHAHATAFGLAEDVTGSIKVSAMATPVPPPGSILIHCGE